VTSQYVQVNASGKRITIAFSDDQLDLFFASMEQMRAMWEARKAVNDEDMERVVSFVRASCERDGLPEWLTKSPTIRVGVPERSTIHPTTPRGANHSSDATADL
jgi:hypothetical protein